MAFIRAKQTGKQRVTYWDENGSSETRIGGNWTWRNLNPGNIGAGAWANRHGAIGKAGGFAVFPSYEIGRKAIFDLLQGPDFKDLKIWDAIPRYAPAEDKNDVARYRKIVRDVTGLDLRRIVKDLNKRELESFVNAVERVEGKFKAGKIVKSSEKKKISAVRKNKKGTIVGYFVEELGWLSKKRAMLLAQNGEIDAVVTRSRSGSVYLKSRPDGVVENNLEGMG